MYNPTSFFLVRAPLNDFQLYTLLQKSDSELIEELMKERKAYEAIAVASNDLYKAIKKRYASGSLADKKTSESIKKYINRLSTRATPYGISSAIGIAYFGDKTEVQIKSGNIKKKCYVDMEWFLGILEEIESNIDILKNAEVIFNRDCYVSGKKYKNPYVSDYGKYHNKQAKTSINLTTQVALVAEYAKDRVNFANLLEYLLKHNPTVPNEIIENFLLTLIKKDYLLTSLRECLSDNNYLKNIIAMLEKTEYKHKIYNQLKEVQNLLSIYENTPVGCGIKLYDDLIDLMGQVQRSKNFLNISSAFELEKNTLNIDIKNEISKFANFLDRLATYDNESFALKSLKRRYIKKYGYYMEVPFLELIDDDIGLDSPFKSDSSFRPDKSEKMKALEKMLEDKVTCALKQGATEVEISDDDIKEFDVIEDFLHCFGFEINLILSMNQHDFELYVAANYGSDSIGCAFNRFFDVIEEDDKQEIRSLYKRYKTSTCKFFQIVECNEVSRSGRMNNICLKNNNYDYSLNMGFLNGHNEIVELNDLYICYSMEIDRLYIKSKKLNQIMYFTQDNMLNYLSSNQEIRLLREISYAYTIHPLDTLAIILGQKKKYLPRIYYGKTIINNETWILEKSDFNLTGDMTEFATEFATYCAKWNIPPDVYICESDKRLLLKLDDDFSRDIIKGELKKGKEVKLVATERNRAWLKDTDNRSFYSDIIVPIENDWQGAKAARRIMLKEHHGPSVPQNDPVKLLMPGDDGWFYFKFYINRRNCDSFLGKHLNSLVKNELFKKMICSYFFIRYMDEDGFHIRFRVKIANSNYIGKFFLYITEWISKIRSDGICYKYTIDVYERELERYGGSSVYDSVEKFFCADSSYVIGLIEYTGKKYELATQEEICVVSIYQIMKVFLQDDTKIESALNTIIEKNDYKDEYRKQRNLIQSALSKHLYDLVPNAYIVRCNRQRLERAEEYRKKLINIAQEDALTNSYNDIVHSIVHMFCNRFDGNRAWERKNLALLRHAIHDINMRKINYLS